MINHFNVVIKLVDKVNHCVACNVAQLMQCNNLHKARNR